MNRDLLRLTYEPSHCPDNQSCNVVTLEYFNEFKERISYRIEHMAEAIEKLSTKCDEFYRHNCELRKELNQFKKDNISQVVGNK